MAAFTPIVAMKPANKAGQPTCGANCWEPNAAEPVERRAGTKGNADRQSTHRTQRRESVSQALECEPGWMSFHIGLMRGLANSSSGANCQTYIDRC
jgi:hypothetical protein